MGRALRASEALRNLTQGLDALNLDDYQQLEGHYTLEDLKAVVTAGVLRLGGTGLLDGELFRVEVPEVSERPRSAAKVRASYENATFKCALAMRTRNALFLGLGHPVVDALIEYQGCRKRNGERFRHVHPPAASSALITQHFRPHSRIDKGASTIKALGYTEGKAEHSKQKRPEARWYRFLPSGDTKERQKIMDRIAGRFKRLGGTTPALEKNIGF